MDEQSRGFNVVPQNNASPPPWPNPPPSQGPNNPNLSPATSAAGKDQEDLGHEPSPRRKHVACRGCRQAKLRCEVPPGGSGPCTRCRRLGLECRADAQFKRVHRRAAFDKLAEQVEQLRTVVGVRQQPLPPLPPVPHDGMPHVPHVPHVPPRNEPQRAPSYNTFSGSASNDTPSETGVSASAPPEPLFSQSEPEHVEYSYSTIQTRVIEDVGVSGVQATQLFKIFFDIYHPYLPILDPSMSIDHCYNRSKTLFWVIISIASRRYEAEPRLVTALVQPCTRLIWSTIGSRPHTQSLIQAIVLISHWPFTSSSYWDDPSYLMLSTAKAAAMQLGLHRPAIITDFLRKKTELDTQQFRNTVKGWAGLYIVAQIAVAWAGQEPIFSSDWMISQSGRLGTVYTLPETLRHNLLIQQFSNNVSQTMSENKHSQTGLPSHSDSSVLMNVLEREYEDLERKLGDNLTCYNKVLLASVRLQLRVCYFFDMSSPEYRQRGLLKAYTTALDFLQIVSEARAQLRFTQYGPVHVVAVIPIAAIVLMKILHSCHARYVDFEAGRNAFNAALPMLRESSSSEGDLPDRCTSILAELWQLHSNMYAQRDQEPKLQLNSRSSASVLHDALWIWRKNFNRQASGFGDPISDQNSSTSMPSTMDDNMPAFDNPVQLSFDLDSMNSMWESGFSTLLSVNLDDATFPMQMM